MHAASFGAVYCDGWREKSEDLFSSPFDYNEAFGCRASSRGRVVVTAAAFYWRFATMFSRSLLLLALFGSVVSPALAGVNVGDPAPDITAGSWSNLPPGMKTLPPEYLKGQIVMLEFWATW